MHNRLISLPSFYKRVLLVVSDLLVLPFAYWMSLNLRLDFNTGLPSDKQILTSSIVSLLSITVFAYFGMYRAMLRHLGLEMAWGLAKAAAVSACLLAIVAYMLDSFLPRSVPFIYFFLLLVVVGAVRYSTRHFLYRNDNKERRRVAIYGAGAAGSQVLSALTNSNEYKPVLFVDDDPALEGRTISGIVIVQPGELVEKIKSLRLDDLLATVS